MLIASSANSDFGPLDYVATQDLPRIKNLLKGAGFDPVPGTKDLVGTDATTDNVMKALSAIPSLTGPDHVVVVYFSGHGLASQPPSVLSLKLAGSGQLDVSQLLSIARRDDATGRIFRGTLIVIIDSCDSGQAMFAPAMPLAYADNTWLLASSSASQNSHQYTPITGQTVSVFTYVLTDGIQNDWNGIDSDQSGFIKLDELTQYIYKRILALKPQIGDQMPHLQPGGFGYLLFDESKDRNPKDSLSEIYGLKLIDSISPLVQGDGALKDGQVPMTFTDSQVQAAALIQNSSVTPSIVKAAKAIVDKQFAVARGSASDIPDKRLSDLMRARIELYAGNAESAVQWYNRATNDSFDHLLFDDPTIVAETGIAYLRAGNIEEAVKRLRYADSKIPVGSFGLSTKNWLASAYVEQNKAKDAVGLYSELQKSKDPKTKALALLNVADIQQANSQSKDAAASYKAAVKILTKTGASDDILKNTLEGYSNALANLGRNGDVAKVQLQIQDLNTKGNL